jgi:hypothetical protein
VTSTALSIANMTINISSANLRASDPGRFMART